MMQFSLR